MSKRPLGPFEVDPFGLGCMSLSHCTGANVPEDLPGYSLRPLLERSGRIEKRTEIVSYSNNRRSAEHEMGMPAEGYAVRTRSHHFFWYADTDEMRLYDVSLDPRGEEDLSRTEPQLVYQFRKIIAEWKESVGMTGRIDIHE